MKENEEIIGQLKEEEEEEEKRNIKRKMVTNRSNKM